jgi:hypothetical protein
MLGLFMRSSLLVLSLLSGCVSADSPEANQSFGRITGAFTWFAPSDCTCGRLEIVTPGIVLDCSNSSRSMFMNLPDLAQNQRFEVVGDVQFLTGFQPAFFEVERGATSKDPRREDGVYDYFPLRVHHALVPEMKVCDDLAGIGTGECREYPESELFDGSFWCYTR